MPKTSKQLAKLELQPQPHQMPSLLVETQKPTSHKRLWLLTGVIVLVLIMSVVVITLASNSTQSTKTTIQATHLRVDPAQPMHDMDHTLTVDPSVSTHDMDHTLIVDPAQPTHDMDHTLTVDHTRV
jgi:hypothetical protein